MRVTTVRLRPLRRETIRERGIDRDNLTGYGAELWVGGALVAVLNYFPEECNAEIVWGGDFAEEHNDGIVALANHAAPLMLDSALAREAGAA